MKVTFKTTLEDILKMKRGAETLQKSNVPCLSCPMAAQELNTLTIGEVSQIYQLNLDKILDQLNNKYGAPIFADTLKVTLFQEQAQRSPEHRAASQRTSALHRCLPTSCSNSFPS